MRLTLAVVRCDCWRGPVCSHSRYVSRWPCSCETCHCRLVDQAGRLEKNSGGNQGRFQIIFVRLSKCLCSSPHWLTRIVWRPPAFCCRPIITFQSIYFPIFSGAGRTTLTRHGAVDWYIIYSCEPPVRPKVNGRPSQRGPFTWSSALAYPCPHSL